MAHTAPPTNTSRRVERITGVLNALVGLGVAGIAIIALNHPNGRSLANSTKIPTSSAASSKPAASPSGSKSASATATSEQSDANSVTSSPVTHGPALVVLSNTNRSQDTTLAAQRFRDQGWTVTDTGSFDGAILSTAAYYYPDVAGAQAAALELQREFPAIKRVKEKFSGLPGGPIVVVLTSDYS